MLPFDYIFCQSCQNLNLTKTKNPTSPLLRITQEPVTKAIRHQSDEREGKHHKILNQQVRAPHQTRDSQHLTREG